MKSHLLSIQWVTENLALYLKKVNEGDHSTPLTSLNKKGNENITQQ
jgi:hypothetical protein